jgi:hypothetical protein
MNKISIVYTGHSLSEIRRVVFFKSILSSKYCTALFTNIGIKLPFLGDILFEIKIFVKLLDKDTKVIHLNDLSVVFPFIIKIFKKFGKIVIFDTGNIHSEILEVTHHSKIIVSTAKLAEKIAIINSDIIISRGIYLAEVIEGIRRKHDGIFYLPDPVDVDMLSVISPLKARQFVKLPDQLYLIGYVSNFVFIKVFGKIMPRGWELIEIIYNFKQNNIFDVKVIFIGTGPALKELRKLAEDRKVEDLCIFTGKVSETDLANYLKAIDIGFMEDYDNFAYRTSIGSKVQEYMAAGKLVITGKGPERLRLLLGGQGSDYLFDAPNTEMYNGIDNYLKELWRLFLHAFLNKDENYFKGKKNEQQAKILFDKHIVEENLLKIYKNLKFERILENELDH